MSCFHCCGCCYEDEEDQGIGGPVSLGSFGRARGSRGSGSLAESGRGTSGSGLGITSGISALLSLVIVGIAIGTGQWLLTEEKLPQPYSTNASVEPDSKVTYSGLWRVCVATSELLAYSILFCFMYTLCVIFRNFNYS